MPGYSGLTFETERLTLRAWRPEDAEAALAIYGDPVVQEYLTGVPETDVESQRQSLQAIIRAYDYLDLGLGSFPMVRKEDGQLVGAILLKPLPRTEHLASWSRLRDDWSAGPPPKPPVHEIEVGWHLARAHWGHGYATEGALRLLEYAFADLALAEVWCVMYRANVASSRVAKRLGMRPLGPTSRFYDRDLDHFVLASSEWRSPQGARGPST